MKNSREGRPNGSDNPEIAAGEVFALGDHRLACGDCRNEELVGKLFSGWSEKFDLLLTDPPYGIDYVASKAGFAGISGDHAGIENDGLTDDAVYAKFTSEWLSLALPRFAERNVAYVFNCDRMIFALREGMVGTGMKLSQLLVWIKDSAVIGRLDYLPQHELIAYGWYGKHRFRGSKAKSVLAFPKTRKNTIHPTMKPLPLLREIILNSTETGGEAYDPFGGSGSTLMACEQTGRRCATVECDPIYCRRIVRRWEEATGKKAVKITV